MAFVFWLSWCLLLPTASPPPSQTKDSVVGVAEAATERVAEGVVTDTGGVEDEAAVTDTGGVADEADEAITAGAEAAAVGDITAAGYHFGIGCIRLPRNQWCK